MAAPIDLRNDFDSDSLRRFAKSTRDATAVAGIAPGRISSPNVHGLSERAVQILQCLVQGESNKMIANRLGIAEATVKVHMKSLLPKIGANNRTQAAIWALNNGLSTDMNPPEAAA